MCGRQYCVSNCEKSVFLYFLLFGHRGGNVMTSMYPKPPRPRRPPQWCLRPSKKSWNSRNSRFPMTNLLFLLFPHQTQSRPQEASGRPQPPQSKQNTTSYCGHTAAEVGPSFGTSALHGSNFNIWISKSAIFLILPCYLWYFLIWDLLFFLKICYFCYFTSRIWPTYNF